MKREKEERRLLKNQKRLILYFVLIVFLAVADKSGIGQMWMQDATKLFAELTELSSQFFASHLSDTQTEEVFWSGNTENASEIVSENQPGAIGTIVIRAWLLNVRDVPNGNILGTVAKEEVHPYYEECNGWVLIKFEEGYGYVAGGYGDRYDSNGNLIALAYMTESTQTTAQSTQAATQSVPTQTENTKVETSKEKEVVKAQALCQNVLNLVTAPQMSDMEKVIAVNQYLCDYITYDSNYHTTEDALRLGRACCQGYANAFKNIMTLAGIHTDYVRGYASRDKTSTHAWNRVLIDGKYYCVDVTWNDGGGNQWLLVPEAEFNKGRVILEYNPSWTE